MSILDSCGLFYDFVSFCFLKANNSIQELNLSYNGFGLEGIIGISECIKYKTNFKSIDLSCTRLTYECAIHLANALKVNTTLNYLDVSQTSPVNLNKSKHHFLCLYLVKQ